MSLFSLRLKAKAEGKIFLSSDSRFQARVTEGGKEYGFAVI